MVFSKDNKIYFYTLGTWHETSLEGEIKTALKDTESEIGELMYAKRMEFNLGNKIVIGIKADVSSKTTDGSRYLFKIIDGEKSQIVNTILFDNSVNSDDLCYTTNTIFMQTEKKDLVSIELLSDGTNKVRGVDETKSWLESGKGEEIGLSYNEVEATHTFGDNSFSKPGPSYWNIMNDLTLKKPELAEKHRMRGTGYGYLGEDSKGLIYFRNMVSDKGKWNYDNQGLNIQFGIAVIDVWTKQVYFYEDYAKNEWNPQIGRAHV